MPTRIFSRKTIEVIVVEHTCLSSGHTNRTETNTGDMYGELYWDRRTLRNDGPHCSECDENLHWNISELEATP